MDVMLIFVHRWIVEGLWSFNVGRNVISGFQTRVPFKIVKTQEGSCSTTFQGWYLHSNKFSSQCHPVHTVFRTRISSKFVAHPQIYHCKFPSHIHQSIITWRLYISVPGFGGINGSICSPQIIPIPQPWPSWLNMSPVELEPKGAEVKMLKWNFKRFFVGSFNWESRRQFVSDLKNLWFFLFSPIFSLWRLDVTWILHEFILSKEWSTIKKIA